MTAPATLLALAERCEAATEYDGRLMAEIDCAVRYSGNTRPAEPDDHPTVEDRTFDPSSIWTPTGWLMSHNYFRRIDDAVELVPKGFMWRLQSWPDGVNSALLAKDAGDFGAIDARHTETFATTPALALTAAALRARAATQPVSGAEGE